MLAFVLLPGGAAFAVLRGLQRSARAPPGERDDAAQPRGRGLNPEQPHSPTRAAASLRLGHGARLTDRTGAARQDDKGAHLTWSAELKSPLRACRAWAMLWVGASFLLSSESLRAWGMRWVGAYFLLSSDVAVSLNGLLNPL